MKRAILVLMLLLPLAVAAQVKDPSALGNQLGAAGSMQANASSTSDGFYTEPGTSANLGSNPNSSAPQQPNAKPSPSTQPRGEPKPKIPGSMVGYIDDAIVATQIRIRFDAGFEDNAPDRAEFFYPQCGCNLNGAPGPRNGQGLVTALNFQQLYMRAEYAPISRFSAFVEVPVRWIQPQKFAQFTGSFSSQAGLSDVQAGIKFAAIASYDRYLTFQLQAAFPSGDGSRGLGTHHYSVSPELIFYQAISSRAALEAMVGGNLPIGGSSFTFPSGITKGFAGDVFTYGVGPSYTLYRGEHLQFTPVIELVGWGVRGGLETQPLPNPTPKNPATVLSADGINIVNLKLGARTTIGAHNSLYVGYGHQLTHDMWYKQIVRVEYRYTF